MKPTGIHNLIAASLALAEAYDKADPDVASLRLLQERILDIALAAGREIRANATTLLESKEVA
jgi:hypothetical protein